MRASKYFAASSILAVGLASIPAFTQTQPAEQQPQPPSQSQPQAGQAGDESGKQSGQQMQSFTGKIAKTSDGLVLQDQASGTTYKLDNQKEIKKFSGKNVKVSGTLDSSTNTIHISDIALVGGSSY